MSAIQFLAEKTNELRIAEQWASLLGQPYRGGGGGIGKITSLEVSATIYHQYSDGDTNYHNADKALRFWLAQVIKADFPAILEKALEAMRAAKKEIALQAVAEHAALMKAAGISVEDAAA